jgi:hypothetical protein
MGRSEATTDHERTQRTQRERMGERTETIAIAGGEHNERI